MKFKPLLYIALGMGLSYTGRQVGLQGDAAPFVPGGVSPERLKYHLIALLMTAAALGFFIAALVGIFRGWRGR